MNVHLDNAFLLFGGSLAPIVWAVLALFGPKPVFFVDAKRQTTTFISVSYLRECMACDARVMQCACD